MAILAVGEFVKKSFIKEIKGDPLIWGQVLKYQKVSPAHLD